MTTLASQYYYFIRFSLNRLKETKSKENLLLKTFGASNMGLVRELEETISKDYPDFKVFYLDAIELIIFNPANVFAKKEAILYIRKKKAIMEKQVEGLSEILEKIQNNATNS